MSSNKTLGQKESKIKNKADAFLDNKAFRKFFKWFTKFKGYGFLSGACVSVSINIFTGTFTWASEGISAVLFLIAAAAFFYLDIVETEIYQKVIGDKDRMSNNDEGIYGGSFETLTPKILVIVTSFIAVAATISAIVVYVV